MNPESGAYDAQKDFGLMQGSNNIIEQCLEVAKINDPESIFCWDDTIINQRIFPYFILLFQSH